MPVDASWPLSERPGFLRLRSLPAPDLFGARNTLTQRDRAGVRAHGDARPLRDEAGRPRGPGPPEPGAVVLRPGEPGEGETLQWTESVYGDVMLLSLATHRYLRVEPSSGSVSADHPGPKPDRKDGSCFTWRVDSSR